MDDSLPSGPSTRLRTDYTIPTAPERGSFYHCACNHHKRQEFLPLTKTKRPSSTLHSTEGLGERAQSSRTSTCGAVRLLVVHVGIRPYLRRQINIVVEYLKSGEFACFKSVACRGSGVYARARNHHKRQESPQPTKARRTSSTVDTTEGLGERAQGSWASMCGAVRVLVVLV